MKSKKGSILVFALIVIIAVLGVFLVAQLRTTGYAASQVGNLSAVVSTYLSCTWSNAALDVSFGSGLSPGANDIAATQNAAGGGGETFYNVTVDTLSNVIANISIKGADLDSGSSLINVQNVSWASNTTAANGANMIAGNSIVLTTSYNTANPVAVNEPIGSSVWYRFWLDVPSTTIAGLYRGNYTMQCTQA